MILYKIDKDLFEKLEIANMFFGQIVRLFGGTVGGGNEFDHKNIAFDQQSYIGRQKGEMRSFKPMTNYIEKFYDKKKEILEQASKQHGKTVHMSIDEENTLG